jgi:hypothetical protein
LTVQLTAWEYNENENAHCREILMSSPEDRRADAQRKGGRVTAIILREQALVRYYASPNICKQCAKTIEVRPHEKIREVRVRQFCDKACSAIFNNNLANAPKRKRLQRTCTRCQTNPCSRTPSEGAINKWCEACRTEERRRLSLTPKSNTNRRNLAYHARSVLRASGRQKQCECGYSKHVECCHRKDVGSFPPEALLGEINALDNLFWACPNCHWEHDHPGVGCGTGT